MWQNKFNAFKDVEFVCGLKIVLDDDFFNHEENNRSIVDDLMDDIADNEAAAALFSRGIHHRNISVIFIAQNLFKQGVCLSQFLHFSASFSTAF